MMKEIEELIEKDRKRTEERVRAEVVKRLMANGKLSVSEIAEVTTLSKAQVEALVKEKSIN